MFRKQRNVLSQVNNYFSEFEPFAASPPGQDDPFFIRYPNTKLFAANVERETSKVPKEPTPPSLKDWSKHTKSCQNVLINTAANPVSPKVVGTDDEIIGEGAACGNSVVKVANQMISATRAPRGFTVASPEEDATAPDAAHYNLMARRGSKSLPVSPAHSPPGSPNSRRRRNGNRYFTSPFEQSEDASNRSWLTMALLGFKKDLTTSTSTLTEEDTLDARLHGSLAESVESLGPHPKSRDNRVPVNTASPAPATSKPLTSFRPKPSELREMNFWTPTSM
ncbi:hypothetical protein MSG28_009687 [Choristoneura fumiferana]|uniref:Uncharacterized protein n=1 Tax=Choristoneura fumiferana TaxID=7141 RepID=A0ACC0JC30_CHOFU|nr:hypothetical protein MSG28_009687 [Choristoneura fumiferana]